jgi:anti-sigma factor (TIGR02949 family)
MSEITPITCAEAFRRLDDYLDRELNPVEAAEVETHLRTCETCAREYAFEAGVLNDVRAKVRRVQAPESLRTSVLKIIEENPGTKI